MIYKFTPHDNAHQWVAIGSMVEYTDDAVADICSCDPNDFGQKGDDPDYETICANATLIASAPTMLYALELCKKAFEKNNIDNMALMQVKSAIAKARGES